MANHAVGKDAAVGQMLGHYFIVEKIGAGGMGEVYRARDERLTRDVAIKVLPSCTLTDESARKHFRKEALILSQLNHPNIATIHDFDTQQGVDFLVMEYIPGITLSEKVAARPLPEKEVLGLGVQLAEGLAAAHDQGVVHRDLKPANLRITSDGRLKILDFGLAKLRLPVADSAATESLSETQTIAGTLPYMAPEQLLCTEIDARTDIHAAGSVLYEMATGQRPFAELERSQLIGAILRRPPRSPTALNPRLSPELERIIGKCLEKEPENRYQSAKELAIDLRRLLTPSAVKVAEIPVAGRKRWKVLVPAALILVSVAIGGTLYFSSWRPHVTRKAQEGAGPTVAGLPGAPVKARRTVAVLGFKNLSGRAEASWLSTALSEMLTTELAAGEKLRTIPGENIAQMKISLSLADADSYSKETLARIRTNLGADLLVLGSYLALGKESGGQIRLDLRLQDARAGETLAATAETGTEARLFDLVSQAGAHLRAKLGVGEVSAAEANMVKAALPSDPEAARLYTEGLVKLRLFDALAARDLLEKAVAADPPHALAHSALAAAWSALGYDAKATEEAKKAFDLSTNLPREGRLLVEGRYWETSKQWEKAIDVYRTLWIFSPDNLDYGLFLAEAQISAGKAKDALATIQGLRTAPPPARNDPRIDLAEARAADALGDFKREQLVAESAATKAEALGAGLLTARARRLQGLAFYNLGELQKALALFDDAKRIYAAAGDWGGVAWAVNNSANIVSDQGDLVGARKMYEEALKIWQEIGDRRGMAAAQNNIAGVFLQQGDLAAAKRMYEKTLKISRETNNRTWTEVALSNLGVVRFQQGDLAGAKRIYSEALADSRETGDEAGVAALLTNVAATLYLQGDLAGATTTYDEALEVCRKIGDDSYRANVLKGLGDVLAARGDLTGARKKQEEALAIKNQLGEKPASAEIRLALAELAIEGGQPAVAEAPAREAAEEFHQEKSAASEVSAHIVLARSLLAQGRHPAAQEALDRARPLLNKSENLDTRFSFRITAALVRQVSGRASDRLEAAKNLEGVLAEAKKAGFLGYELEAELALGEIELQSGNIVGARRRLEALEGRAVAQGFGLIARKAAAALQSKDRARAVELLKGANTIALGEPTNLTVFPCPVYYVERTISFCTRATER